MRKDWLKTVTVASNWESDFSLDMKKLTKKICVIIKVIKREIDVSALWMQDEK